MASADLSKKLVLKLLTDLKSDALVNAHYAATCSADAYRRPAVQRSF